MTWDVEYTDQFGEWWATITAEQQEAVTAAVSVLQDGGPALGRPLVDTIASSRHSNMKELRASKDGALRVLFAFDPLRSAILLLGGNKSGRWDEWYRTAVPLADDLYDKHLADLEREGRGDAKG
ncbi:MAG: diaminopimelate decarboxylase [Dehalococcoidia bacterium]|nr:MAG: diaminopimelate decarboxylase [Dehalococcoidia bacterium]